MSSIGHGALSNCRVFVVCRQKLKAVEGQMKEKCDLIASLKEELEKVQEAERLEKSVSVSLKGS